MRIVELHAVTATLPLKKPFKHASASRQESTNIFVRATLEDGTVGWGEGVPREYVTGETPSGALEQFAATDWPRQLAADCQSAQDVVDLCLAAKPKVDRPDPRGCYGNALRCAVELSLLDAYGRCLELPLGQLTMKYTAAARLRREPAAVRYSTTISAETSARERSSALKMRLYGFQQCKFKVGVEGVDDEARVRRLRRWLGWRVDLRLDANEAWSPEEAARVLRKLAPFRVSCVEQPLPHAELAALKQLRSEVDIPVMLDESLTSFVDAETAITEEACDLFNIRLSKCGGFLNSLALAARASEAGLGFQLGCHPGESGLLSAAGRHFASTVDSIQYLEGSYDGHLLREQFTQPDITFGYGGRAPALLRPGLGVDVVPRDFERLQHEARTCRF